MIIKGYRVLAESQEWKISTEHPIEPRGPEETFVFVVWMKRNSQRILFIVIHLLITVTCFSVGFISAASVGLVSLICHIVEMVLLKMIMVLENQKHYFRSEIEIEVGCSRQQQRRTQIDPLKLWKENVGNDFQENFQTFRILGYTSFALVALFSTVKLGSVVYYVATMGSILFVLGVLGEMMFLIPFRNSYLSFKQQAGGMICIVLGLLLSLFVSDLLSFIYFGV